MSRSIGDFDQNTVIYTDFTTVSNANSVAATLANGNVVLFKDNSNANSVEGLTLSIDWGVTGRHLVTVNTASNATRYSAGSFFHLVLNNGNVSGTSVAGYGVGSFTIRADSALKPTVAGRSVLVDANGNVSANVVIGTATMNANVVSWLGTAPQQLGAANGIVINGVNGGNIVANLTGNMTGSVGSMNGNVGGSVLGNMNGNVLGSVGSVLGNVGGNVNGNLNGNVLGNMNGNVAGTVSGVTGNVGGNVNGSTGSVLGNIGGNLAGNVNGDILGTLANISANAANFAANTLLDMPNGIEVGITPRLALRYTTSSVAGNLTGGNTATVVITGVGVANPRITAAVEANGNTRTVTLS